MNELKRCPFCGGEAIVIKANISSTIGYQVKYSTIGYQVKCTECFAYSFPVLVDHPVLRYDGLDESTRYIEEQAKEKAIEKWNRRSGT